MSATANGMDIVPDEGTGTDRLKGIAYWIALVLGTAGVVLTINQTFNLHLSGGPVLDTSFYYLMLGLFMSLSFLAYPAHSGARRRIPWYDWTLFVLCGCTASYLAWNGARIVAEGWDLAAPETAVIVAGVVCALALEAVRRAGGTILFAICAVFAAYPLFAEQMPGVLWGPSSNFAETLTAHALGVESIIGVPLRTVASLLVGFLIFGSALVVTGGGDFFMCSPSPCSGAPVAVQPRSRSSPAASSARSRAA